MSRRGIHTAPNNGATNDWITPPEIPRSLGERLRNVTIIRRDLFETLEKIDDHPDAVIYCDPPYLTHTRSSGGGSRYEHDFEPEEHVRLAGMLRRFRRARVVLSYYDAPELDALYAGWTKRLMTRRKNLHVQNRRGVGRSEAPEVLLLNGPSFATSRGRSLFAGAIE